MLDHSRVCAEVLTASFRFAFVLIFFHGHGYGRLDLLWKKGTPQMRSPWTIMACTHCNMNAYSNTFVTQFRTKLGKPDGDWLSPLIYNCFQWWISMKGVPQKVSCKDTRWLLSVETLIIIFTFFKFLAKISESQKNWNYDFWPIYFLLSDVDMNLLPVTPVKQFVRKNKYMLWWYCHLFKIAALSYRNRWAFQVC